MDLKGKRALVFGVASDTSIAWGITQHLIDAGATCVLGYQKRFMSRILQLTKDVQGIEKLEECDVSTDESVNAFFEKMEGKFDILVHCIGFAPVNAFKKSILFTAQEDFEMALTVSSYSLVRLVRHAIKFMNRPSSVMALTYLGAVQVVPAYKVMGTAKAALESLVRELASAMGPTGMRVNAISAGPIPTLAASGIPGFNHILDWVERTAPLRKNVTQDDIGNAAVFLASDNSGAITGQTIYVDSGYSIMGVPPDLEKLHG